jgi:outer membrane murein-binding lipoprotein Lpp
VIVGELLGGLALFAALGALALAGSAISKAEKQFNELVQTQINPLRDRIADLEAGSDQFRKAVQKLDKENSAVKEELDKIQLAIGHIHEAHEKLGKNFEEFASNNEPRHRPKRKIVSS